MNARDRFRAYLTHKPEDRARYAETILAEAERTDNAGVANANREQAVQCYLAAAEDCAARLGYAPKTLEAIRAAYALIVNEGRSL